MLVGAAILGLIAVFIARMAFTSGPTTVAAPVTASVVAAKIGLSFGDKITRENLQLVQLPPNSIPTGAFRTIAETVTDGNRIAQRSIAANEVIVPIAVSGSGNRLSTMGTIGPAMRAISVILSESTGVGGLIAPGDHVDVYITRTPPEKQARFDVVVTQPPSVPSSALGALIEKARSADGRIPPRGGGRAAVPEATLVRASAEEGAKPSPITDLLLQDVRVLAIGQNTNVSTEKPELVKSATLEVTPAQVSKLTLGQSVGTLTLALRPLADKDRTAVASLRVEDLHDGGIMRAAPRAVARVRRTVRRAEQPSVVIVRGGKETTTASYVVPGGK